MMTVEIKQGEVREIARQLGEANDQQLSVLLVEHSDLEIADLLADNWKAGVALPNRRELAKAISAHRAIHAPNAVTLFDSLRKQAASRVYCLADDAEHFATPNWSKASAAIILRHLVERAVIRQAVLDILAAKDAAGAGYCLRVYCPTGPTTRSSRCVEEIMGGMRGRGTEALLVRRFDQASASGGTVHAGVVDLGLARSGILEIATHTDSEEMTKMLAGAKALAASLLEELGRTVYVVDAGGSRGAVGGAAAAVNSAASSVYLHPMLRGEHVERLERTGRTAWSYGFSTALIELDVWRGYLPD